MKSRSQTLSSLLSCALAIALGSALASGCNKESTPPSSVGASNPDAPTAAAGEPGSAAPPVSDEAGAPPAEPAKGPAHGAPGASCMAATDCDSGVCEGEGCGEDTPGVCADPARMCTRDLREYCGCDGQVFRSSGSCPGQRYARKGAC